MALRYSGADIEAMKAVATAHQNRNLQEFETALATYTNGKKIKKFILMIWKKKDV